VKKIAVSVGDIVAWVHKRGDLNYESSYYGRNRAAEGRQIHKWLQKKRQKKYAEKYLSEVSLDHTQIIDNLEIRIRGRIDGLCPDQLWFEEIKSLACGYDDVLESQKNLHWAQLYLYAYLYCQQYVEQQTIENLELCLTYVVVEGRQLFEEHQSKTYTELSHFFATSLKQFVIWADLIACHEQEKLSTAIDLEFPYPEFRAGQREMSAQIYQAIRYGKPLMVQAATGIGKTLASLFPAIKSISKGNVHRLAYLSARTTGQLVARESINLLRQQGLTFFDISITAKSKVCLEPEAGCDPLLCPYAKDYFSKLSEAMEFAIQHYDSFERENIEQLARQFQVCPFELSLDLANCCDAIIGDYNYFYDPNVSLKRLFNDNTKKSVLLVDEAHNLVERAREMYSGRLLQEQILELKHLVKTCYPVVSRHLVQVSRLITRQANESIRFENNALVRLFELPDELLKALSLLRYKMEAVLAQNHSVKHQEKFLSFFFDLNHFLNMANLYNDNFTFNLNTVKKHRWIEIYCLSPAEQIQNTSALARTSIYFSATMTPHDYYAQIFAKNEIHSVEIASPFPPEKQLTLLATHIPTVFKQRQNSIAQIQDLVKNACSQKKGNYLVFFPSYIYLELFLNDFNAQGLELISQQKQMNEVEKEQFLAHLSHHQGERDSRLALAVMGGGFSEGIDLKGDQLIGCFVIGVGLPQINFHQDLIKDFYTKQGKSGFAYAYQYPGISKILQSAGRVIRTCDDKGFVLLIDSRYGQHGYQQYLPPWWRIKRLTSNQQCQEQIVQFWASNNSAQPS